MPVTEDLFYCSLLSAEDHETDYEYEGSDNDEDPMNEGEPRCVYI